MGTKFSKYIAFEIDVSSLWDTALVDAPVLRLPYCQLAVTGQSPDQALTAFVVFFFI